MSELSVFPARLAATEAKCASARLAHVWADSAYQGFAGFALLLGVVVTVVGRAAGQKRFKVQTAGGWWSGRSAG